MKIKNSKPHKDRGESLQELRRYIGMQSNVSKLLLPPIVGILQSAFGMLTHESTQFKDFIKRFIISTIMYRTLICFHEIMFILCLRCVLYHFNIRVL